MFCVLSTLYCVLRTVYCVLCTVYRCSAYCVFVLCPVLCILCTVFCELFTVLCLLCSAITMYVLCSAICVLCSTKLCTMCSTCWVSVYFWLYDTLVNIIYFKLWTFISLTNKAIVFCQQKHFEKLSVTKYLKIVKWRKKVRFWLLYGLRVKDK